MTHVSIQARVCLVLASACATALTGSQAFAQTVVANIPVPGFVGSGAVEQRAHRVYIPAGSNGTNGVVEVINAVKRTIATTIELDTPWPATSAALNPRTGVLWVGAENGGLFEIETKTYKTIGFVNVNAAAIALNPETDTVYVSDFDSTLSVVDGKTRNIVYTNSNLGGILNLVADPFNNRVYIAMQLFNPGAVWVLDGRTNEIIAKLPAGSSFTNSVALDPFHDAVYSADQGLGTGTATIYSTKTDTQIASLPISGDPDGVAVDPLTRMVFVSDLQNNQLDVINGKDNTLVGTLAVGSEPGYLTDDPVHKLLFVGTQGVDANGNPLFWITVVKTK
jgi:DNA-binding beta-propeller fold protein YncE